MIDRKFKNPNYGNDDDDYYPAYFNIESDTDKCGFVQVAYCDEPGMSYEFNSYIVLKDKESGLFYGAGSSGCSCPTPFEEYQTLSSLTPLRDLDHLKAELRGQFSDVLRMPDPDDDCDSYASRRGPMKDVINKCLDEARQGGLK